MRYTRQVALAVYAAHAHVDQLAHALASLQRAMAWDEREFGREYDLGVYNIVAVDDFNMGAMENKARARDHRVVVDHHIAQPRPAPPSKTRGTLWRIGGRPYQRPIAERTRSDGRFLFEVEGVWRSPRRPEHSG